MRGARIWLPVAVLFLLASAAAVAVPLVRGGGSAGAPDPRPTAAVERFACAQVASSVDDYCRRIAADLGRRAPLADGDRAAARPLQQALMEGFVRELGADCPGPTEPCLLPQATPPEAVRATPPEAVRRALVAAGFVDPVVRAARITDPAPSGAVLYAARAGYACLVGHVQPEIAAPPRVVGRLPDGACLST
ncbi:hypothetical protein [Plantactinospora soyae]|uniref:DUF732 domain-containing protein n=1 Tax=Plantactinospora soyae TaxID=1544732 RepID=A0A927MAC6_9ACTN|nr:hypothetical protein [Plantactinospora soyae]MBE1489486.1 hypothetical protein [Plantactinospora soyae]